jgi:hypothetical protein
MALISKTELFYKDYSWSVLNGDNPKISGEPDNTLLSRNEGFEILYFVNKFAEKHNFKQKVSAIKVEKMIRNEVPTNIHSQEKIKKWLEEHWKDSKF